MAGGKVAKFSPETRVALRAALAAVLAMVVTQAFALPRWYWAVMVSTLLVNGTWGENVRKAGQRLGMTAVGCGVAWELDRLKSGHPRVQVAVMLAGVFLAVYFRTGSYGWMTFFISVYVVFLFAIIGLSPQNIVRIRIYETAIGCGAAFVASLVVPPPRSRQQWRDQLRAFWQSCAEAFDAAYRGLLDHTDATAKPPPPRDADLIRRLESLRAQHRAASYEGLLFGLPRERIERLMDRTRLLGHDVLALTDAATACPLPAAGPFRDDLAAIRDCTLSHMRAIIIALQQPIVSATPPPDWDPCDEQIEAVHDRLAARALALTRAGTLSRADLLAIGPLLTYTQEINRVLRDVREGFDDER